LPYVANVVSQSALAMRRADMIEGENRLPGLCCGNLAYGRRRRADQPGRHRE
jgi:hypothetical protein